MATRVYVSFDYDHDKSLKDLLVGQSKHSDSPFEIHDWSIKEPSQDWQDKAQARAPGVVAVVCGLHTHWATGVAIELKIARTESKPYFLLKGYSGLICTRPTSAQVDDKIYQWTWDNLKALVGGAR